MTSGPRDPILLWSASNAIKHLIGSRYLGYHYVWCSPVFDGGSIGRYAPGARQPPSSDPVSIYRNLLNDVTKKDRHSNEIKRQREGCQALALRLLSEGRLATTAAAEIGAIVNAAECADWRPLIYAIPYSLVADRVQAVPFEKRASFEPEFIIPDLREEEFHIIEPMPC